MRRPFGMPSWAFWVVAVVVAGVLGNVPRVGMLFTAAVLVAALVYWVRLPKQLPPGVVPITSFEKVVITARQEVVGESFYQAGIGSVVAAHGRAVQAVLVHEPENKHSPSRSAVRVDLLLNGAPVTCGYLPEVVAPGWVPMLVEARRRGALLTCDADVRGGRESAPSYGVWLTPPPSQNASRRRKPSFEPAPKSEQDQVREFWSQQGPSV